MMLIVQDLRSWCDIQNGIHVYGLGKVLESPCAGVITTELTATVQIYTREILLCVSTHMWALSPKVIFIC